ncbi:conserved hypothetical protein [Sporisorium reilianum SRZ2]|uniref:Uncharacterized protein n=1 Tax=Sporisorium reilianum (strain SRZ2) TaxID=999809 RepID=E6ZRP6_SPORE|nr:conserved hypothetical protein [Sporisorium reilianum SRZ2]
MNLFGASSGCGSAPSSDVSSPALPELSLDASLQRLHQQEDFSASSISSSAPSRAWLQSHQQGSSERHPSSPIEFSSSHLPSNNLDHNQAFRFPSLKPAHSATQHTATGLVDHQEAQPQEPAFSTRPRTSRGLTHPKPFLSSSRATSIASLAEVDVEPSSQIAFGTPFATGAFEARDLSAPRPDSSASSSSIQDLMRDFPAPSPRQPCTNISTSPNRVETRRLQASPLPPFPSAPSSWTLLFVPLEQQENVLQGTTPGAIVLPLLSTFEDQVEQLKVHLVRDLHHEPNSVESKDVELHLDLSCIAALPARTSARITPQSWSIMFERFLRRDMPKDEGPLPHLYRKTGLPIAASIRYRLTLSPDSARSEVRSGIPNASVSRILQDRITQSGHGTHDSSPWARRESEMTLLPSHFSTSHPPLAMAASRSYPGAPRTPVQRGPLSYSPSRSALHEDVVRHQSPARSPFKPTASSMSYSLSEGSKLRALSLAAVYPLSSPQGAGGPMERDAEGTIPVHAEGYGLDRTLPTNTPERRQRYSRGSSHKSFPSSITTLSSCSTKDTSIRSSRTRLNAAFDPESAGSEDETDDDLGSRFWTHLFTLGEQVGRESKPSGDNDGHSRPRDHRSVSVSSTASDASVFSFSPLGILVPTDGPLEDERDVESTGTRHASNLPASHGAPSSFLSPALEAQASTILGRRRAYSSMVPLTGWRAGDSDLRTAEGQRSISSGELPRVLVLEPRGGLSINALGHDHADLVTPTMASFQGRARALSVQPLARPPFGSADPRTVSQSLHPRGDRQNVWDEAMLQLTERLTRSNLQSSISRQISPERNKAQSWIASGVETQAFQDVGAAAVPQESNSSDAASPDVQSSPLPGLFYDNWVERVDGGVDGDLGRRGSTFESKDSPEQANAGAAAAASTSRIAPGNLDILRPGSSSDSHSKEFDENEPLLQALQESDWPVPQPRSEPTVPDASHLLSASKSFISVASPMVGDGASDGPDDDDYTQDFTLVRRLDASSADKDISAAPPASALTPIWLTRSQTTWLPQISEPQIASHHARPASASLPSSSSFVSDWADLAQRLRSPGSMRLLCLAASSWSVAELGIEEHEAGRGGTRSSTVIHTGLAVPFRSADTAMTRSRSFSAVGTSVMSMQADAGESDSDEGGSARDSTAGAGQGPSAPVGEHRHRSLARKKAELLEPIRIPLYGEERNGGRRLETGTPSTRPMVSSRMKRSLSNIFDLASPIELRPRQQQ